MKTSFGPWFGHHAVRSHSTIGKQEKTFVDQRTINPPVETNPRLRAPCAHMRDRTDQQHLSHLADEIASLNNEPKSASALAPQHATCANAPHRSPHTSAETIVTHRWSNVPRDRPPQPNARRAAGGTTGAIVPYGTPQRTQRAREAHIPTPVLIIPSMHNTSLCQKSTI